MASSEELGFFTYEGDRVGEEGQRALVECSRCGIFTACVAREKVQRHGWRGKHSARRTLVARRTMDSVVNVVAALTRGAARQQSSVNARVPAKDATHIAASSVYALSRLCVFLFAQSSSNAPKPTRPSARETQDGTTLRGAGPYFDRRMAELP